MSLSGRSTDFIFSLGKLKIIPRSGWVSHNIGIQDVESVADHTFSTSAMAMLLADMEASRGRHVDVERVIRMALLHDLAESLTFDISKSYLDYLGRRGESIKQVVEQAAWKHIAETIPNKPVREKYAHLQSEFDAEKTFESKIVHAADKLDILFQIIAYLRKGYPRPTLSDLWTSTNRNLARSEIPSVKKMSKIASRHYRAL